VELLLGLSLSDGQGGKQFGLGQILKVSYDGKLFPATHKGPPRRKLHARLSVGEIANALPREFRLCFLIADNAS
jgi:hypothetical protein